MQKRFQDSSALADCTLHKPAVARDVRLTFNEAGEKMEIGLSSTHTRSSTHHDDLGFGYTLSTEWRVRRYAG